MQTGHSTKQVMNGLCRGWFQKGQESDLITVQDIEARRQSLEGVGEWAPGRGVIGWTNKQQDPVHNKITQSYTTLLSRREGDCMRSARSGVCASASATGLT